MNLNKRREQLAQRSIAAAVAARMLTEALRSELDFAATVHEGFLPADVASDVVIALDEIDGQCVELHSLAIAIRSINATKGNTDAPDP